MPLYDYRLSVLSVLLPKIPKPRLLPSKVNHLLKKHGVGKNGRAIRKSCQLCYTQKIRKDTAYFCDACPEKPSMCQQPCFNTFHSRINI